MLNVRSSFVTRLTRRSLVVYFRSMLARRTRPLVDRSSYGQHTLMDITAMDSHALWVLLLGQLK